MKRSTSVGRVLAGLVPASISRAEETMTRGADVQRRRALARVASALCLTAGVTACASGPEPEPEAEPTPRNGTLLSAADFIVLPAGMDPARCRAPSQMPTLVAQARLERPCRAMKAVQGHLGELSDFRLVLAKFTGSPDDPVCLGAVTTPETQRLCEMFGPTYHPGADESDHEKKASPLGRQVFPRLSALMIASTCPIDRHDAELGRTFDLAGSDLCGGGGQTVQVTADNWWWELPPHYRDIADIHDRAAAMRADVLYWLEHANIRVTSTPGSGGSFDLDAIATLHFLYLLRDHPELLPNANLLAHLLRHGMHLQSYDALDLKHIGNTDLHGDDAWEATSTFQSGNRFSASMDEEVSIGGVGYIYPETENHVLVRATYQYLVNQWLTEDYHGNLEGGPLDPYMSDTFLGAMQNDPQFVGWYDNYVAGEPSELVDRLLAALHRVNHNGLLETNATPHYQAITMRPLLMLATWAEDEEVKLAAENALHVLSAQFAFQSLHGRRLAPARRSCDYAWSNTLYDGVTLGMGAISGAYAWNDSPYGYRWVIEGVAGNPAIADADLPCNTPAANASECHFRSYTWKRPKVDLVADPYTNATPYNENGNLPGVPSAGTGNVETLASMVIEGRGGMLEALSGYEIPEAVHQFMLTKQDGYFARMMARFDEQHHPAQVVALPDLEEKKKWPEYFEADLTRWDGEQRDERVPELYFAGPDSMQVAGGVMNALWYGPEAQSWDYPGEADQLLSGGYTCSRENGWLHYLLHYGREDEFGVVPAGQVDVGGTSIVPRNIGLEEYDAYSRPTTLLLGVPRTDDPVTGADIYRPFGVRAFPFEEMVRFLPMLPGHRGREWRSVNNGVWKGFAYGYDTSSGKSWAHYTPWENDPAVPKHSFGIDGFDPDDDDGPGLEFKIYDLRQKMADLGLDGFWLVTARVWKRELGGAHTGVSRGFWEIVPGHAFGSMEKIESEIDALNDAGDFPSTGNDEYVYTSIWSGEKHVLEPEVGYLQVGALDGLNDAQDHAQAIAHAERLGGGAYPNEDYYIALWSDAVMEALPLMDVKAVDSTNQFVWRDQEETAPTYYACARDGWMCVNAIDPANPSATTPYLWVDARRCDDRPGLDCDEPAHWEPHWESGTYDATTEDWPCSCATGSGGWIPGPPQSGTPDGGGGTPPPPPDGGDDDGGDDDGGCVPPACGSCESSLTDCTSDTQCSDGNVCQWQYDPAIPRPVGKCGCPGDPSLCDPDAMCVAGATCPSPHHTSCSAAGMCICEGTL